MAKSAAALLLIAAACGAKGHAEVDGVLIPQADGVTPAERGATLAVDVDTIEGAAVPEGEVVRLAIGRKVPWDQVQALIARVEAAGARPVLLAGAHHKVKAIALEDPWPEGATSAIQVISYIDGKACVQPEGAYEAKCVQSGDRRQIDRAFLRELVREQVRKYDLPQVELEMASGLHWDDVVRTIDGARTCCYETRVAVRLKR
jgi:hypothetical protein